MICKDTLSSHEISSGNIELCLENMEFYEDIKGV